MSPDTAGADDAAAIAVAAIDLAVQVSLVLRSNCRAGASAGPVSAALFRLGSGSMRKSNAKHEPAKDASGAPAAYLSADERRAAGKALRDATPRARAWRLEVAQGSARSGRASARG